MRKSRSMPMVAALCGLLVACAPMERALRAKNLLSAAGFTVVVANTVEREQALSKLPANKFVQRPLPNSKGMVYLYADPLACGCLYIGNQTAWNTYKQEQFEKQLVQQEQVTATGNDAIWNANEWGPGWWH